MQFSLSVVAADTGNYAWDPGTMGIGQGRAALSSDPLMFSSFLPALPVEFLGSISEQARALTLCGNKPISGNYVYANLTNTGFLNIYPSS